MEEQTVSAADAISLIARFQADFPAYAESFLKLVDKKGRLIDFKLNPLQEKLHAIIESQLAETGKARVIVLKSRKLGMSTYAAGRFTRNCTLNQHKRAAVITHVADSTAALFRIYKRFYENLPQIIRPELKSNNSKEIEFESIDSSIKVATAGSGQTGRGDTFAYLHASEIGFWPNDYEIAAGLLQAIPDTEGTEVIIESTPNGLGNLFHSLWEEAVKGTNGFIPVFFGWNEDPDCALPVPSNFQLQEDEKEYAKLWKLSNEQVFWRRQKIKQIGFAKFTQEYPISAAEAFRASTEDAFIQPADILRARKTELPVSQHSPLILGVDVARGGKDDTCIVWRQGRVIPKLKKYNGLKGDEIANRLIQIIKEEKPTAINVDGGGGYGGAVIDCLRLLGYEANEISFSGKPYNEKYFNRRAEMYGELKDWLATEVSIPDMDEIEQDLTSFGYSHRGERLLLESKDDVRKRLKRSPDIGDAIALTFAMPINELQNSSFSNKGAWSKVNSQPADYAW